MEALNRDEAIPKGIDPTGRKWVIKGERGTALVHARPDPDRADAIIPKEFEGRWTSPTILKEKLDLWLTRAWDRSDEARIKATRKAHAERVEKKTAEESLAELPDEIKDALGDLLEVKDGEENDGTEGSGPASEVQERTDAPAAAGRDSVEDKDEEQAGRAEDTGREEEEEKVDYAALNYADLLAVAKEKGITAKKKVEILEALNA